MSIVKKYSPFTNLTSLQKAGALTLIFITLMMLVIEYYGWQGPFFRLQKQHHWFDIRSANEMVFYAQVWTTGSFLAFLLFVPWLYHKIFPMEDLTKTGLGWGENKRHWKVYLSILLIMLPVLFFASTQQSFHKFYPLYKPTSIGDWLKFECVYLLQFICVEYFFRGFGLFRLEKAFPKMGVFLMTLPYALIHIHKPFPEALGSIIAGLILGSLALKSRSIWLGVWVHAGVAFSIDWFCLLNSGAWSRF